MDIEKLIIFYHVAKAGKITGSGVALSPSAVSRQMKSLEAELRVQLFYRYPNRLVLTDEGHMLYETVGGIISKLEYVREGLFRIAEQPKGLLKVATAQGWPAHLIINNLPTFFDRYPEVNIVMLEYHEPPDFRAGDTDVAFFPYIVDQPSLKHTFITRLHFSLYASQGYVDRFGAPKTIEDLDHHRLITYSRENRVYEDCGDWHLKIGRQPGQERQAFLSVERLLGAAAANLGIVTLVKENHLISPNSFVPILPDVDGPEIDLFYIVPEHLEHTPKARAFSAFLEEILPNGKFAKKQKE